MIAFIKALQIILLKYGHQFMWHITILLQIVIWSQFHLLRNWCGIAYHTLLLYSSSLWSSDCNRKIEVSPLLHEFLKWKCEYCSAKVYTNLSWAQVYMCCNSRLSIKSTWLKYKINKYSTTIWEPHRKVCWYDTTTCHGWSSGYDISSEESYFVCMMNPSAK